MAADSRQRSKVVSACTSDLGGDRSVKNTEPLRKVATVLLMDAHGKHWGYSISRKSGVRSGVMYPMLTRMLNEGWIADGWEDPTTITDGRPPRRYYELTDKGRAALGEILREKRSEAP